MSDLAASPDGQHVYASCTGTGGADVAVLDTSTGRVKWTRIAAWRDPDRLIHGL